MPPVLRERYLLGERLGAGGMADVHRADDTTLERQVAVKVLREAAGDASDRARFVQEARTLASLSHRNLVMVLDAGIGDEDDRPFLVMELVEGRSLADAVAAGPLTAQDVARIGADLAAGLAYAHERGVVHRDVKPANVLLSDEGRVKLADFGIARLIGDTVRHTRTGTAVGTAAYLSPEQVRGEDVTGAADVYALGLVLLEALTGTRAFPGSATESALARLQRDAEVPGDLPGGWASLLTSMTAADPATRPAAGDVARVLADGVPTTGGEPDGSREGPGSTALLTAPVATTATPLAAGAAAPDPPRAADTATGPARPALDRAGDALARVPAGVRRRWTALAPHQRGVAGALTALVALVVLAGMAAGGTAGVPGDPSPPADPPADVPAVFSQLPVPGGGEGPDPDPSDGAGQDAEQQERRQQRREERRERQREERLERQLERELEQREALLGDDEDDD